MKNKNTEPVIIDLDPSKFPDIFIIDDDIDNWYKLMLKTAFEFPKYTSSPRGSKIKESRNVSFQIDPLRALYKNEFRSTPRKYFAAEMIWYLSRDRSIDWIAKYSKFWEKIVDEAGQINSNYGELILDVNDSGYSGWTWCYDSLAADKDTRQAVLHFNNPSHRHKDNKDFPCTMYGIFSIRENKIELSMQMRSSDVVKGISFDIPFFSCLLQSMHLNLLEVYPDLKLGKLHFFTNSLHAYETDWQLIENILSKEITYDLMKIKYSLIDKTGSPNTLITDQYGKDIEDVDASLKEWLD
jgi:thymidylate synthase